MKRIGQGVGGCSKNGNAKPSSPAHEHEIQTVSLTIPGDLDGVRFDVILCAMTLHHVRDTGVLLRRFRSLLEPEGFLAIADLDKEDGSFHSDPTGVEHMGFLRNHLARQMMDAGFTLVSMETVHHIEKSPVTLARNVIRSFLPPGGCVVPDLPSSEQN